MANSRLSWAELEHASRPKHRDFIMNAYSFLNSVKNSTEEAMNTWLESNLCRWTGYEGIRKAVKSVLEKK